jgi:hypothetical protein
MPNSGLRRHVFQTFFHLFCLRRQNFACGAKICCLRRLASPLGNSTQKSVSNTGGVPISNMANKAAKKMPQKPVYEDDDLDSEDGDDFDSEEMDYDDDDGMMGYPQAPQIGRKFFGHKVSQKQPARISVPEEPWRLVVMRASLGEAGAPDGVRVVVKVDVDGTSVVIAHLRGGEVESLALGG